MSIEITIIAGTNRPNSMSSTVATHLLSKYQQPGVRAEVLDLNLLPAELFAPASYEHKPASFDPWQQRILDSDGLLFVVPEYNGSFPGALKYFIDMWKYPDSFENRCVAYVGIAAGMWGGLRPIEHLQGVMGYRNAHQFNQRVFINSLYSRWDSEQKQFRKLTEHEFDINELLLKQAQDFVDFCRRMRAET